MASSLSLSHVSNVTLISVYVVNVYVSRRLAVTDKSDIISGIRIFRSSYMCFGAPLSGQNGQARDHIVVLSNLYYIT